MTCPACHKADAIAMTEFTAVGSTIQVAVSVSLPAKVCGRCGIAVAKAALIAAIQKWSEMRGRAE